MKPSQIFEGENSSLRKSFNEAVKVHLAFCGKCQQKTNHYDDGRCTKCEYLMKEVETITSNPTQQRNENIQSSRHI